MSTYKYQGPPEQRVFGPLPEGEYPFIVAMADPPYEKDNGNLVMSVKLTILPDNVPVFCNPWQGTDRNGEAHDQIAEFLLAINRVPAIGTEPKWAQLVGARGRCRLTTEEAQQGKLAGKLVNKVHYWIRPTQADTRSRSEQPGAVSDYSKSDLERARQEVAANARGPQRDSDLDVEPDDIPY
jgi:hypothetical protein